MDAQPDFELQQELQRFTTQFVDRVTQATEDLERVVPPDVRDEALRKNLLYASSAMEIAAGPFPTVNLLDMTVFIRLSRAVLENHWIPELYRDAGAELSEVFAKSEQELSEIAAPVLTVPQQQQLAAVIDAWLADNPDQVRVEGIRLGDFSAHAGSAAALQVTQAKGLLSSVKTASRAANQALLLSERGLFLFHRMPFLWRMQARLGAREILRDSISQLADGPEAPVPRMTREAQRFARQGLVYVAVLGGTGMLLWWIGSLIRK